jgi:hypothetical protein
LGHKNFGQFHHFIGLHQPRMGREVVVLFGHAVEATQVAVVGERNAEVIVGALVRVGEHGRRFVEQR